MKDKEYISLEKMIEYAERALRYTNGYTFEETISNSIVQDKIVKIDSDELANANKIQVERKSDA